MGTTFIKLLLLACDSISLSVRKPDTSFRLPSEFRFPTEYRQLPNHSILGSINSQGIPGSGRQVGSDSQVLQGHSPFTCLQKNSSPIFLHLTKLRYLTPESFKTQEATYILLEKEGHSLKVVRA